MIFASRFSHRERSRKVRSIWAGSGLSPNRPRLKLTVAHTVSKASAVSSCGTRPMRRLGRAGLGQDVVPADRHRAGARVTMPQTMLMRVVLPARVRPEQGEDLALADVQVDAPERGVTGGVGVFDRLSIAMMGVIRSRACQGWRIT